MKTCGITPHQDSRQNRLIPQSCWIGEPRHLGPRGDMLSTC